MVRWSVHDMAPDKKRGVEGKVERERHRESRMGVKDKLFLLKCPARDSDVDGGKRERGGERAWEDLIDGVQQSCCMIRRCITAVGERQREKEKVGGGKKCGSPLEKI